MTQRARLRCLAALGLPVAVALSGGAVRAQAGTLKWAHVYETHEVFHRHALWAAEEIGRRSEGRWHIEVVAAAALGKEPEIDQALAQGKVDIAYIGLPFAGRVHPPLGIAAAPFVFRDADHWEAFRASPLLRDLARQYEAGSGGRHVAGLTYYGQRHLTSNKAVRSPADLRGIKLRVPDAALYRLFPNAVGAQPTPIPLPALYVALKDGLVDAQENPLATIDALRLLEVQKFLVLTAHVTESLLTVIGAATWARLSAADRTLFDEVMWEASARAGRDVALAERALLRAFAERGTTVLEVERGPFVHAVQKALAAGNVPWPQALHEAVLGLR